jgi:Flp pilus assembly protein TadD
MSPKDTKVRGNLMVERAKSRSWGALLGAAGLLVAATAAAYWQAGDNGFVNFDDNVYVTANQHVREGLTPENVKWAFTNFDARNWHPLTWLSHMADVSVFGVNPRGHHLVNVGLHIASVLLLLLFLWHTSGYLWRSALVAGLFAMHPLHVESVAWISERKDVLSTLLLLATMLAWVRYAKRPGWLPYLLALVLAAMGLMAKPMLVTLPVVLLILDYWPLGRTSENGVKVGKLLLEKLPFAGLAAVSAIMAILSHASAITSLEAIDLPTRATNAIVSYWRYIQMMVWPADLAVLYPHPLKPLYAAAAASGLFLVVVTGLALWFGRSRKYLAAGWLWYLVTLVPVLGIIQVGDLSHADRYSYVPLIGIFIVMVWGAAELVERKPSLKTAAVTVAIIVMVACGVMTWRTVQYWRNDETLFGRAVSVTKDNYRMMMNLGVCLNDQGRYDEAIRLLRRADELRPGDMVALHGLGNAMFRTGRYEEALAYYTRETAVDPAYGRAYLNMGLACAKLGRFREAEGHFRKAIAVDPAMADTYIKAMAMVPETASLHSDLGVALKRLGRLDEAAARWRKALSLDPNDTIALTNLREAGKVVR